MKKNFNTTITTVLALIWILSSLRINAQYQQISWSRMDDTRHVTKLATFAQWATVREDNGEKLSTRCLTLGDSVNIR